MKGKRWSGLGRKEPVDELCKIFLDVRPDR